MTADKGHGNWLPNETQLLLLKASLLEGQEAVEAWRKWVSMVDIDDLEEASNRLLPLLSSNLDRLRVPHPLVAGRLRGIRRWTWYSNQIKLRDVIAVIDSLSRSGIRTVVLKGVALLELFYRDYSLRPMNDVDILVSPEDAAAAIYLMNRMGCKIGDAEIARYLPEPKDGSATMDWVPAPIKRRILIHHGAGFSNRAETQIDLHWHVLQERFNPADDEDFWASATALKVGGISTLALDPTASLLHVLAHGARWCEPPSIRWISDAMYILRSNAVCWDRFEAQTMKSRLVLPVRAALAFLSEQFQAPIPAGTIAELRDSPTDWMDRAEFWMQGRWPGYPPASLRLWFDHRHRNADASLPRALVTFPRYLQRSCALDRLSDLPGFVLSEMAGRLRHQLKKVRERRKRPDPVARGSLEARGRNLRFDR